MWAFHLSSKPCLSSDRCHLSNPVKYMCFHGLKRGAEKNSLKGVSCWVEVAHEGLLQNVGGFSLWVWWGCSCEGEPATAPKMRSGKREERPGQTPCGVWEVEGFPCVNASLKDIGLILDLQQKPSEKELLEDDSSVRTCTAKRKS